jgi:hypothetical protein
VLRFRRTGRGGPAGSLDSTFPSPSTRIAKLCPGKLNNLKGSLNNVTLIYQNTFQYF